MTRKFNIRDRFNFLVSLVLEFGEDVESALYKAGLNMRECIYAHDNFLPTEMKIDILERDGKRYQYVSNGIFRRIDSLGRFIVDKRTKVSKSLGFIDNPLRLALARRTK